MTTGPLDAALDDPPADLEARAELLDAVEAELRATLGGLERR